MSEDRLRRWMEANRLNWDDRTAIHLRNSSGFYAIDRVKSGDDLFHGCEDAELGEVAGKRLIHLQCHFGLDTIRLARRGATATGLDFSAPALAAARALAAELGVAARFVEGNVYDAPSLLEGEAYDIAFVTWGAIIWLPDIRRWAQIVAGLLAPGGWLYLAEGHPSTLSLEEVDGRLVASGSWRTQPATPFVYDEPTTYTGDPHPARASAQLRVVPPAERHHRGIAGERASSRLLPRARDLAVAALSDDGPGRRAALPPA